MAAEHPCSNCRKTTTNDNWLCQDCLMAAQRAQMDLSSKLGRSPNFAETDEARQAALVARFHEVNG